MSLFCSRFQSTCVRVAVDLGLFELIAQVAQENQGKGPVTAKELAAQSQAEHLLIGISCSPT